MSLCQPPRRALEQSLTCAGRRNGDPSGSVPAPALQLQAQLPGRRGRGPVRLHRRLWVRLLGSAIATRSSCDASGPIISKCMMMMQVALRLFPRLQAGQCVGAEEDQLSEAMRDGSAWAHGSRQPRRVQLRSARMCRNTTRQRFRCTRDRKLLKAGRSKSACAAWLALHAPTPSIRIPSKATARSP